LRDRLAGRPWEEHVRRGELELQRQGLDPAALHAETRARFEQRLLEHDRAHLISHEYGVPQIAAPGLVLGTIGPGSQLKNADVTRGHSVGDHQHAAGSHPEPHVFRNGKSQTLGVGHHLKRSDTLACLRTPSDGPGSAAPPTCAVNRNGTGTLWERCEASNARRRIVQPEMQRREPQK